MCVLPFARLYEFVLGGGGALHSRRCPFVSFLFFYFGDAVVDMCEGFLVSCMFCFCVWCR